MDDRLILASASPRRRDLMAEAGYAFDVEPADVAEDLPAESDDPAGEAARLAEAKARAVARRHATDRGRWVVGADTLVVLGRRIIGKPRHARDAEAILRTLSGTEHAVITGLALVQCGSGRSLVRHAATGIRMRPVADDEIRRYVAAGGSH